MKHCDWEPQKVISMQKAGDKWNQMTDGFFGGFRFVITLEQKDKRERSLDNLTANLTNDVQQSGEWDLRLL